MPWHCKPLRAYARDSEEAQENARMIYSVLSAKGWTVNAICGMLGNQGHESGYNPWRWQNDVRGTVTGSPWKDMGYGLVQFTPASKYIDDPAAQAFPGYGPNFLEGGGSLGDGNAQLLFIDAYADYYSTSSYPLSYAEFKASKADAGYLASAWLYNYERPGDPSATEAARREEAGYWWGILSGETPIPPTPTPTGKGSKFWVYMANWNTL